MNRSDILELIWFISTMIVMFICGLSWRDEPRPQIPADPPPPLVLATPAPTPWPCQTPLLLAIVRKKTVSPEDAPEIRDEPMSESIVK